MKKYILVIVVAQREYRDQVKAIDSELMRQQTPRGTESVLFPSLNFLTDDAGSFIRFFLENHKKVIYQKLTLP